MYSVLPGLVSVIFLFYGLFVVGAKGINRVTTSFLVLCVATFFWQFTWALLFQVDDATVAMYLIRIGWLLILFIPSALYHFLAETSRYSRELKWVYASYAFSAFLSVLLVMTDLVIAGYYDYFFGYYPKAGPLHTVHVAHVAVVVLRALYITYRKQAIVQADEKAKLRLCIAAVLIYFFAAIDYASNYGLEVYPPGVVFIAVSLAILTGATVKYHLMDSAMILAASIAHELRTPLATIKLQANLLKAMMPELLSAYQLARHIKGHYALYDEDDLQVLKNLGAKIEDEAKRANHEIDMLLVLMREDEDTAKESYRSFSAAECVEKAVENYPYASDAERNIAIIREQDFNILAPEWRITHVINNLIKNSLYSVGLKGSGEVKIAVKDSLIEVIDTGVGIPAELLPHVFDNWFTTKPQNQNAGIGLTFCKRTMESIGGSISCESVPNSYTKFSLHFRNASMKKGAVRR